jgi:hypothetical protein
MQCVAVIIQLVSRDHVCRFEIKVITKLPNSTNQQLEFITTIKECKLILNMYIVLGTIPSKTGHLMQTIVNYIHIHIYSDYKVDELSFLLVYIIGLEYFLTETFPC